MTMAFTSMLLVLLYTCNAQFTVMVVSNPPGDGSNGFPISSALNLTCMISPTPADDATITYEWIENCDAIPQCFVTGQTTATVSTSRLKAEDSGSYQCQATINNVAIFSANEFIVRVTGATLEVIDDDNNDNVTTIGNYSYFYDNEIPTRIVCRSGLLLSADNVSFYGGWYYNNQPLRGIETCLNRNPFVALPSSISSSPGVLLMINCNDLTLPSEGLYVCRIRDTDLTVHELKVGFYFNRGAPRLFGPVINGSGVALVNNNPVLIGCLADGVPPDQFFLTKDDVVINSNYVIESVNQSQYRAFIQHNITSLEATDYGAYRCIYVSPVETISNLLRLSGPTMPPQNFVAILVTSDSFTLSWTILSGLEPGGLQIGYEIECNPGDHTFMVNGSVSNVMVTGLFGDTTYSCTIFGYSQVIGPISDPLLVTTLQGAPLAPQSFNVMVTSSTAITVSWQTPSVTNGIISYYTLYYYVDAMEYSVNVAYNGQMSQSQTIYNLQPYQNVAVNVSATTGGGEGPSTNQIVVRTLADLPGYVGSVEVRHQSDTSSIVEWTPPLYPNGVIISYRLIFTNSNSTIPNDITVDGNVMSYSITNLVPGVLNRVQVIAENDIGSGPATIQEFFTKQLSPTAAPQNVTVKRFSDAMLVSWNELSIVQSRGFPIYTVQYQSTDAGSPLHINDISENYVIIENLLPNNDYLVSVAAAVREGQEVLTGPSSESVEVIAISFSSTAPSCSGGSDCSALLGLLIVFILLFLICLAIIIVLLLYMWRQWKKTREEEESQTNLTKTAFEFASRENFHLKSSQASIGAANKQEPTSPPRAPPPHPAGKPDDNELNIYETIDKRVRSNQRREAELQRASTISTGTTYESIDRKNKSVVPPRSNTISTDSQPARNPSSIPEDKAINLDVSDPYTFEKTLERQTKPTVTVTDIYADSTSNTTNRESINQETLNRELINRESINRESINRESLNLEMFTPATEVVNWQAPSTGDKTMPTYSTTDKRKKAASQKHNEPEDMVSLID